MSGLGELDHPGTPESPGAWDERSQQRMTTAETTSARQEPTTPRRTTADPVRALMHRHRDLCEGAVDPLEIAAGLEAHGVTDRTAARFRHRDVFSLAEEMFARAAHDEDPQRRTTPLATPRVRADWILLTLLPGTIATATTAALRLTHGQTRLTLAAAGTLALALSARAALSRGPLATIRPLSLTRTGPWTYWLITYTVLGDGLLHAAITGGPDAPPTTTAWPLTTAPVLALAWSLAPASWTTHLFTTRARHRLPTSRGLQDFATAVRPLLLGTFALYLSTLTALLILCTTTLPEPPAYAQTLPLGALLLLARLLTIHGFPRAPRLALAAAAAAEATALATSFAARLPGCAFLATPVETLVDTWGPAAVPALTCTAAALPLLIHATRTLTRASAHAPTEPQC
ncbi:hypothetical protein [Streptomyces gilvus]|uniref:hypothetical protein n=1 Tax=Streptomyces gilvus TaxID=2920937 RepID=UPI001F0EADED|nr:hypothetical protein [Streptomyces sp. CME 23]MCH5672786.1 hypothetical protein [Streptomyces sp. CME 23]